jgi:hypothetical protein
MLLQSLICVCLRTLVVRGVTFMIPTVFLISVVPAEVISEDNHFKLLGGHCLLPVTIASCCVF